jgi:hypothetical protein
MRKRRRQADLPVDEFQAAPFGESTLLDLEAEMGKDNAPKFLGSPQFVTLNPFHRDENILISNRAESESRGDREARLARRLVVLLRRWG